MDSDHRLTPLGIRPPIQSIDDRLDFLSRRRCGRHPAQQRDHRLLLIIERPPKIVPCSSLQLLDQLAILLLDVLQLFFGGDLFADHPLPHANQAVVLLFPFQTLYRFVTLVTAGSGMALWLSQIGDMNDGGDVLTPNNLRSIQIGLAQGRIVPPGDGVEIVTLALTRRTLEPPQDRGKMSPCQVDTHWVRRSRIRHPRSTGASGP